MNLIIDGNYILNRNLFSLTKDRMLYGHLYDSLVKSVESYSKWFPFNKIYFISDSKTNWRKSIYPEYKANRKKSDDIDWEFVFETYNDYKSNLPKNVKVLELDNVEGDDWFYYLTKYHNDLGECVLMVSNDGDLKQLVKSSTNYINIMVNENNTSNNVFVPSDYKTWMSTYSDSIPVAGLFDDISDKLDIYKFIRNTISSRTINEVVCEEVLFEKIISGDRGDNIKTVWGKPDKSGNIRGIGIKTSQKLYQTYLEYFGYPKFDDECFNRISDIIIDLKKLDDLEFGKINKNIKLNNNLVNFNKIPDSIIKSIKNIHEGII